MQSIQGAVMPKARPGTSSSVATFPIAAARRAALEWASRQFAIQVQRGLGPKESRAFFWEDWAQNRQELDLMMRLHRDQTRVDLLLDVVETTRQPDQASWSLPRIPVAHDFRAASGGEFRRVESAEGLHGAHRRLV